MLLLFVLASLSVMPIVQHHPHCCISLCLMFLQATLGQIISLDPFLHHSSNWYRTIYYFDMFTSTDDVLR